MKQPRSAVIIGAGIGGLALAARLAKNKFNVTVFEKEAIVGGRANRLKKSGYIFDTGPTLFMMTDVLSETFAYCGKNFDDYIELIQLEPNYQVIFGDSSRIEVSSNLPRFSNQLAALAPNAPEQFYRFFADVAQFYRIARTNFIDKNFDKLNDFIDLKKGLGLAKKHGLSKLWNFTGRYYNDERLRQLFSFQSMYLGVSPYQAPAIYSTVSYMETGLGIWYPKGGMYSLSKALEQLCLDMGVQISTNQAVDEIIVKNNRASGVKIKNQIIKSDIVVANADLIYSYKNLILANHRPSMSNDKLDNYRQAGSAVLFFFGVSNKLKGLLHHNVVLAKDFKQNLTDIFELKKLPNDPSFYLCVPSKTDPNLAPAGKNVLYILVPVPSLESGIDWDRAIAKLRKKILIRIQKEFGLEIHNSIETEVGFTPKNFEAKYNLHMGSAFGLSHSFFQSGYFRPHNYSKDIGGLYFVGASTYPGGGVPMVILSAKLVMERIMNEK